MSRAVACESSRASRGASVIPRLMLPHDIRDVVKPIYRPVGSNQVYELYIDTNVPVDDQFSSPKQIRWSAALGKLLVANGSVLAPHHMRNSDLSFFSKYRHATGATQSIDSDLLNVYLLYFGGSTLYKLSLLTFTMVASMPGLSSVRMIDASGDPDYVYVTSNNATDGHGVRKIRKSDMTVVASILSTGSGDGQFNNPLGVKYYDGYVYVADVSNTRIVKLLASDLTFVANYSCPANTNDLDTNGVNWFLFSSNYVYRRGMDFSVDVSVSTNTYSGCIIPDQGDGYGATLAIVDSTNNHLERRKCSDLSAINSVGSAGDAVNTLCDPVVTGPAGIWIDSEGGRYAVASGANISKNGFSGDFFRQTPNRMTYQPNGKLSDITAIDFNADAIQGEIKNLYKCVNLTSCKLQTNPSLVLDLSRLSAKLTTLRAYACGTGIFGSIRHMLSATSINLRENGASQAQVDQWIGDLYANKDVMTPGTANFNGTNSAPSAAGKAQADELVADYAWTITYTP